MYEIINCARQLQGWNMPNGCPDVVMEVSSTVKIFR